MTQSKTIGLALALLASGCFAEVGVEDDADDEAGVIEQGLDSEKSNGSAAIVDAHSVYHAEPDVAMNQWAETSVSTAAGYYCNGVMIGPNIYFSAAHCGLGQGDTIL